MQRIQKKAILKDLEKKIVLLVGPRQAGKTWLALDIAKNFPHSIYLNYDQLHDREIMKDQAWPENTDLLILDELHKMPEWKNYLKGLYDTKPKGLRLLVTGSARLETYDHIGDSLAGRYFRHRLMPFSLAELTQIKKKYSLNHLIERGGFPEPFLAEDTTEAQRWRHQYLTTMLSTDIFEIEIIQNLKGLNLLVSILRQRVGSPISYQSISEDAAISPKTVKKYIQILESLFVIFPITPYSKNIARSLLKEPKIYFYDTGLVQGDEGVKLENTVAVSLFKHASALTDSMGEDHRLHYLRTKDGLEVDFALVKNEKIEQMIEVKSSNKALSKSLTQFAHKYEFTATQIVKNIRQGYQKDGISIQPAEAFLKELFL